MEVYETSFFRVNIISLADVANSQLSIIASS